jgi:hypothetical protein
MGMRKKDIPFFLGDPTETFFVASIRENDFKTLFASLKEREVVLLIILLFIIRLGGFRGIRYS